MVSIASRPVKIPLLLIIVLVSAVSLLALGGMLKAVIFAILFAFLLDPVVTFLESRGLSRALSTSIIVITVLTALYIVLVTLLPIFTVQIHALHITLSSPQAKFAVEGIQNLIRTNFDFLGLGDINITEKLVHLRTHLVEKTLEFLVSDFVFVLLQVVVIPFIVFFFLKDGRTMKKELIGLIPNRYFEFAMDLLHKMTTQLGRYLRSQFLDALFFGILTTIVLGLLDVQYFLFIGVFAGLANLIPFVGPVAGGILGMTVSILTTGDPMRGVFIGLTFVGLKLVDDFVIQPLVLARGVDISPLLVLLSILIGGQMFGVIGMLLAVPTTGFFKVVINESVVTFRKYRFS